jgi:hypothetical protein
MDPEKDMPTPKIRAPLQTPPCPLPAFVPDPPLSTARPCRGAGPCLPISAANASRKLLSRLVGRIHFEFLRIQTAPPRIRQASPVKDGKL